MNGLLTDEELTELTGVEQPAAQMRVLEEHGLKPIRRRDGKPRVTWEAVSSVMTAKAGGISPDWSAISGRA